MNVSVIGAGQMGNGIAQVFATKGHQVTMVDLSQDVLDQAYQTISGSLDRLIRKERITEAGKQAT
ncbi:MAG: 3-hydroxyacyl-CoA dehydrogenase NAD-binding domain-containing protein, partial [Bacteroidota bacterium]